MRGDIIYQIVNGEIDRSDAALPEGVEITDEFGEGRECGRLYERVYNAKLRLGKRLGIDEDSDVEEIINCMSSISRILATKMFEYGRKLAMPYPAGSGLRDKSRRKR